MHLQDHLEPFHVIYNLSSEFHLDDIYSENCSDGNSSYNDSYSYDDSLDFVNYNCSGRSDLHYASDNYFPKSSVEYIRDTPVYDRSSKYRSNLCSESWRDKLMATSDKFCHSLDTYSKFSKSSYHSCVEHIEEDERLVSPVLSSVTSVSPSTKFSLSSKMTLVPARDYASGHFPVGKVKSLCAVWEARTKSAKKSYTSAVVSGKKGSQAPAASQMRRADDAGTCGVNIVDQSNISTVVVPSSVLDTAGSSIYSDEEYLNAQCDCMPESSNDVACIKPSVEATHADIPHSMVSDTCGTVITNSASELHINITFAHYNDSNVLSDVCNRRDGMNYVVSKIVWVTCKGSQCICMLFDQYVCSASMVLLVINRFAVFYIKAYKFLFSLSCKHIWKFFDPGGYMSVYGTIIHRLTNIFTIL